MRVIGIDPGTGRTGWAVVDKTGGKEELVECGCFETKPKTDLVERLNKIFDFVTELVEAFKPDEAAVEEVYFAKNAKTAMSVGQARGVVLLAFKKTSVELSSYTPLEIKRSITGYGVAKKAQVGEMVKRLLNLEEIPKPDDAADAVAVALTHLATNKKLK